MTDRLENLKRPARLSGAVLISILAAAWLSASSSAAALVDPACRALKIDESQLSVDQEYDQEEYGPEEYRHGLLWQISRQDLRPSYLFGTIHVSDEAVLALPEPVAARLSAAETFVMEALPEPDAALALAQSMFFADGQRLDALLSPTIFERTVQILAAYNIPASAVAVMKPWAAFLTMNYPPAAGIILDLHLLNQARKQGAALYGLETLQEQAQLFADMPPDEQLVLLGDTVCHYDLLSDNLARMKALYLQGDLQGLVAYAGRYRFADHAIYDRLLQRLLVARNYSMVERMQGLLARGNAFIALGALHLPGPEGILALLARQGYVLRREY